MSISSKDTRETPTCCCSEDKDLTRLLELMGCGIDQATASRMVWGHEDSPSPALAVTHPGRWARRLARHTLVAAFPWLILPTPTEVS